MSDLVKRLRFNANAGVPDFTNSKLLDEAADHIEALEAALERIVQWSEAYPLDIFPEPDWKKAASLLKAGGMTLDSVSAHCMRHVVEGVGKIARAALAPEHDK